PEDWGGGGPSRAKPFGRLPGDSVAATGGGRPPGGEEGQGQGAAGRTPEAGGRLQGGMGGGRAGRPTARTATTGRRGRVREPTRLGGGRSARSRLKACPPRET